MPTSGYKEYYISVDSRHRDRGVWPSSAQYEVKFDPPSGFAGACLQRSFKSVVSLELMHAIYPNSSNVLSEMYLNLHIPEVDGIIETTNAGSRCFAKLIPSAAVGYFVQSFQDPTRRPKKIFPFRGARLDKITVEFRDANGALFDFGADAPVGQAPDPMIQTSLMFKIIVEDGDTVY